MEFVYSIVENGESYPNAYKTYMSAVFAVKEKHKEYLEEQLKSLECLECLTHIENILSDINVPENVESGKTYLYIEKGIHIFIYKLPIT